MNKTMNTMWKMCEEKYFDLPAVRWLIKKDIQERTYGELTTITRNIRKGLAALGFEKSHISLIGTSSVEWIEAYMAVVTTNNAAVPLDCGLAAADIVELVARSDSEGVFLDLKFAALADAIRANCPKVRKIWLLSEQKLEDAETIADLIEAGKDHADANAPEDDDISMIVFTSGTTGKSKGVMLTQSNLYCNIEAILYHIAPGRTFLSVLPVHHAFCLVMDWLNGFCMGGIICINDSLMHMVRNMSIFNPHVMLMVPLMIETIYKRIKAAGDVPPEILKKKIFGERLEHIFSGGAHLEPYYIEEFKKFGIQIFEGYGMSECSPVISSNRVHDFKAGSIGKPLPNVEVKIADSGEILVRGTSVMQGYYNMEKETSEVFEDGWLHTGDKGYIDEDGFLFINGRVKNLIILSNGENISPEEIEGKLALNELIGEIVVTGDDNLLTARIFPDPQATESMTPEDIQSGLQKILDSYNSEQPTYRQLSRLVVRKNPFFKNSSKKIIRTRVTEDEPLA